MLTIHRHTAPIAIVTIAEQTVYSAELMGIDKIDAMFDLPAGYAPAIGDCVVYDGREYRIRHATGLEESAGRCIATFCGEVYDLYDVPMSHLGRTRFSFTGTPVEEFERDAIRDGGLDYRDAGVLGKWLVKE